VWNVLNESTPVAAERFSHANRQYLPSCQAISKSRQSAGADGVRGGTDDSGRIARRSLLSSIKPAPGVTRFPIVSASGDAALFDLGATQYVGGQRSQFVKRLRRRRRDVVWSKARMAFALHECIDVGSSVAQLKAEFQRR
jgi:hypothetical protein